jgi:lipopolysaccharide transport system ATP-binding protein
MYDKAIIIENISKQYRLGVIGTQTLRGDLQRAWWKVRGKGDPTLQIGQTNRLDTIDGQYVWALKDINLEIKKGEILGIIGKNGAGKSTLLKILSRVTSPTTGSIKINGRMASLLEVGTGFHPELTGRENIFLNGAILGMRKYEIQKKLDEIVDFAGVAKYLDTPVKRYSSGMYVRLAFAVAAHLEPDILIVDEVLAVGDAEFQKKAIGKMQDVSRGEGRTVLFVSHNMASVKALCNRGVLLENGRIKELGNIDNIVNTYLNINNNINNNTNKSYSSASKSIGLTKAFLFIYENIAENFFKLGSEIYLKITVTVKDNNLRIGIALNDINERRIFITIKEFNATKGNVFVLKLPSERLTPGKYSLDFGLYNNYETEDFVKGFLNFEIIKEGTIYENIGYDYGLLQDDFKWEII